jgi:hypothetical protein
MLTPNAAEHLSNLARMSVTSGKPQEAAELMRTATAAIKNLGLGADHPDAVRVRTQCAKLEVQPRP